MTSTCNSAGRPNNKNAIRFSQQPRSTMSLFLLKERRKKFDKKETNTSSSKACVTSTMISENLSRNEPYVEQPEKLSLVEYNLDLNSKQKSLEEQVFNHTSSEFKDEEDILPKSIEINHGHIFEINKEHIKGQKNHGMNNIIVGGVKSFSCSYPQCSYITTNSSNMSKHRRTHSQKKLYLCEQCTFSTKFSNSLNVHKRLHTQEKPFACQNCDYTCNSSSNLKKHVIHRHSSQYIQRTSLNKKI